MRRNPKAPACNHEQIYCDCSVNAAVAGFKRVPPGKRLAASTHSGREGTGESYSTSSSAYHDGMVFPDPLVLSGDDLALDPNYPPQSFRSWLSYHKTMPITADRKTIYVVPSPEVGKGMKTLMKGWTGPHLTEEERDMYGNYKLSAPKMEDVCAYLRAFYHKMDVKVFDGKFTWKPWSTAKSNRNDEPKYLGLETPEPSSELFGIRYRPSLDGVSTQQLKLNDILDALDSKIPPDAYAIIMLVNEDLYEDDQDEFCAGRAYGASRICIVSSFRYNPMLDLSSGIDYGHMWPSSHCKKYVDELCGHPYEQPTKRTRIDSPASLRDGSNATPLRAAIQAAHRGANGAAWTLNTKELDAMWFSRVGRTASHEVGHCLGFDHCVYFACVMQGTASVAEDVRQPPYLCPVCLQKLSWGLASHQGNGSILTLQRGYIKERYEALREFCDDDAWKTSSMFAGWNAWAGKRLEGIAVEEKRSAKG